MSTIHAIPTISSSATEPRQPTTPTVSEANSVSVHNHDGKQLIMKSMLFATLFSASLGPLLLMEVDPDSEWAKEFSYSMIGGTLGVVLCLCLFEVSDVKKMARVSLGNFVTAVGFGPVASWFVSKSINVPVNPAMLVAVAAGIGFMGTTLIQTAQPIWLRVWQSWNGKNAAMITGEGDKS